MGLLYAFIGIMFMSCIFGLVKFFFPEEENHRKKNDELLKKVYAYKSDSTGEIYMPDELSEETAKKFTPLSKEEHDELKAPKRSVEVSQSKPRRVGTIERHPTMTSIEHVKVDEPDLRGAVLTEHISHVIQN